MLMSKTFNQQHPTLKIIVKLMHFVKTAREQLFGRRTVCDAIREIDW